MRKIIHLVHTSIDGYVAGPNGDLNWFENAGAHLEFVNELIEGADAALFGRITYEMFEEYWPTAKDDENASTTEKQFSNWYNSVDKIVLSKEMQTDSAKLTLITDEIAQRINQIKNTSGKDIIIFGSPTVSQILTDLDMIDEYWIFINPVFFRSGVPLFSATGRKSILKLIETKTISNGEVALHYCK